MKFSIATLLVVISVSAFAVRGWQMGLPLDHFEIDVAGPLVDKLPSDTVLRVVRNPDYRRSVDCEMKLGDLPARLPGGYPSVGCVVEFWSTSEPVERKLFSMIVDRSLFDEFRVITLKLEKPKPVLNADWEYWVTQKWSPNVTQRMRYLDLPWWNSELKRLEPIREMPKLVVSRVCNAEILEHCRLEHTRCDFRGYYAELDLDKSYKLRDGDQLEFSVEYDSGGLFEAVTTSSIFKYSKKKHQF